MHVSVCVCMWVCVHVCMLSVGVVCVRVFACVHVFAYAHVCTRVCMCACVYVNEGGGEQAGGVPGTDFCCDYSGVSQSSSALPIIQTGFLDK